MLKLDWLWFWKKADVVFVTSFSMDECQKQLANALDFHYGVLGPVSKYPVIGEIEDNKFYLTKKYFLTLNIFNLYLYGSLISIPGGTRVQASFGLNAINSLLLAFGICAFSFLGVKEILSAQVPVLSLTIFILFWIVFVGGFILIGWFGSWSKKSNRDLLIDYLRITLLSGY